MAVGNSDVSLRTRSLIAAVSVGTVAILAFVVLTFGSRTGASTTAPVTTASSSASRAEAEAATKAKAKREFAAMPLFFEPNHGQTDPSVRFLSHSGRHSLYLTDDSTIITMVAGKIQKGQNFASVNPPRPDKSDKLVESAVRIRMVGANPHPAMTGLDPLPARVNYLVGEKANFHPNVETYARVKIANVYPGVDIIHYGSHDTLEYDIVAAPGADTSKIKFSIEGAAKTTTDKDGNIFIATGAGMVVMRKPVIYQQSADGSRIPVDGGFVLAKDGTVENHIPRRDVAIRIASYDHSRQLVIDPVLPILVYSSYLGGNGSSSAPLNLEQFSFVTGNNAITDSDVGFDVALDSSNNAYVTGTAFSDNFPTPGGLQTVLAGATAPPEQNPNVFVAKFNYTNAATPADSLVWSTYLGAAGDTVQTGDGDGDLGFGIAVNPEGTEVYVVGQTYSGNPLSTGPVFPGTASCGAFGRSNVGKNANTNQGFISKLTGSGSAIDWSCYVEGKDNAIESRVAVFPANCGAPSQPDCQAYVAGATQSTTAQDFPITSNAFQSTLLGTNSKSNATFLVFHPDGSMLDYGTYYGGTGNGTNADAGIGVAVDSSGNGYITGATYSTDLVTKNPAIATFQGATNTGANAVSNAFVAEFEPTAANGPASLIYATYLGGSGATGTITFNLIGSTSISVGDVGTGIAIDSNNKIWVTGLTASTNFPLGSVGTPFQSTNNAGTSCGAAGAPNPNAPATAGFVEKLDTTFATLAQIRYGTYFGGCGIFFKGSQGPAGGSGSIGFGDASLDIALAGSNVYITGVTTGGIVANSFPLSTNVKACTSKYELSANQSSGITIASVLSVPLTAFVTELTPGAASGPAELTFSSLLGGTGEVDGGIGIKVDSNSDIVVAGLTFSSDFPVTPNAFQFVNNTVAPGNDTSQAFLSVMNPSGNTCPTPFTFPATPTPTATSTGGATPTATATATATSSGTVVPPTATATATATRTATATATSTSTSGTPTATATRTATATATATQTATATATRTATATATSTSTSGTPTATATATRTATATPTASATATATRTATATATATATGTGSATPTPTATPTPVGMISIKPNPVKFGNKTVVGDTSKAQTVTITNSDGKKSHISVTVINETALPPFEVTSKCIEKVLAPKKKCKIKITFSPTDTTPAVGSLLVFDSASETFQAVPLTGTGKAPKVKK